MDTQDLYRMAMDFGAMVKSVKHRRKKDKCADPEQPMLKEAAAMMERVESLELASNVLVGQAITMLQDMLSTVQSELKTKNAAPERMCLVHAISFVLDDLREHGRVSKEEELDEAPAAAAPANKEEPGGAGEEAEADDSEAEEGRNTMVEVMRTVDELKEHLRRLDASAHKGRVKRA